MSTRKRAKNHRNLLKQIWKLFSVVCKRLINWLLRSLLVIARPVFRQARLSKSGFVLPTVAMVSIVVVLLTTALVIRSFSRSENASNVRVNQAVLNAATPAIDRARAKIDALFSDSTLPRETPSDIALYNAFNSSTYNFGDETRLKLVFDINQDGTIQKLPPGESYSLTNPLATLENDETLTTAWKFPVDTDNNGKFDSYTLYGIYFRSPSRDINDTNGKFNRSRQPLEVRTPPMAGGVLGSQCSNLSATSASLIGDSSWYKSGAKLTKSFFVYTATVPITNPPGNANYEAYKGNKGFSALEFQQDKSRFPLTNNAALFQDDLEITPGPAFRMNGKIFTNGNLLIGGHSGNLLRLYQVSSKNSCFYKEENSKITVGGNVGTGNVADAGDQGAVTVDLYNGFGQNPGSATIDGSNKSTNSEGGAEVGYNDAAYNRRIALMKQTALSVHPGYNLSTKTITPAPTVTTVDAVSRYPQEVKDGFRKKITAPGGNSLNAQDVLADRIEIYLKNRTRRVPYAEIPAADGTGAKSPYDTDGDNIDTGVFASGTIEPIAAWREPTDANTRLTLNTANLKQTQPEQQRKNGKEKYLGDRVYVGNNLPAYWKKGNEYVTGSLNKQLLAPPLVSNTIKWTEPNTETRYRTTQVVVLQDVGISNRDGSWEDDAAQQPTTKFSNKGGLRVITGAGIYRNNLSSLSPALSTPSFMSSPTALDAGGSIPNAPRLAGESTATPYNLVWPDSVPMKGGTDDPTTSTVDESTAPPDLRMRATAVYHYKDNAGTSQTPIACVSSYYDPTDSTTAQNGKDAGGSNLPVNPDPSITAAIGSGRSNNGVVYPPPYTTDSGRFSAIATYLLELKAQAKLMFPNGRIVNEPLQQALTKINGSGQLANVNKPLSLSENSALDTAICAIRILSDNSFTPSSTPVLPHGAIKEATFLNAREIKAIDKTLDPNKNDPISQAELSASGYVLNNNFNLPLEQRQPLEVRVTDINLGQLAATRIGPATNQEYLLPNSGIIYTSRDGALPDLSDTSAEKELLSPTDFRLDPTRRPNGIRLINGSNLARDNNFRPEEKGLILVTNLPAYIRGEFNLHQQPGTSTATEEFQEILADDWGNFDTRNSTLNNNFACRKGQTGCGSNGDQWRPATIISDTMTLLSASFRDGFRNEGDYDLNNNAGSSVIQARKTNGFWENSFVPSALWWNTSNTTNKAYPAQKTTNSYVGSYLTNGVTPVQRRVDFPEYVMEICRKLPVSACQPEDWVVGYDNNTDGDVADIGERDVKSGDLPPAATANRLGAGTTARPALEAADQRYARRVAFARNSNGMLKLTQIGNNATAIPLGIDSAAKVSQYPYPNAAAAVVGTNYPPTVHNALWFRTTTNTAGNPGNSGSISYANNQPLYYLPPNEGGAKLVLPDTPDIPGVPSLNLPVGDYSASDYAVCIKNGGISQNYISNISNLTTSPGNGDCPTATYDAISNFIGTGGGSPGLYDLTSPNPSGSFTTSGSNITGGTLTAQQTLNVYALPKNNFANGTTIRLDANGNPNAIFVLQAGSSLGFGANCAAADNTCGNGVVVELLNKANPNNVFWAINGAPQFENVNSSYPHKLFGNFVGKSGTPMIGNNTQLLGRILGFVSAPNIVGNATITAITSIGQPSLVPVLQIHSPEGSPNSTLDQAGNISNQWSQAVTANTNINAVFVTGNSPSRPAEGDSAGLHNFVRFLQNWDNRTLKIKGSFMQFKRSAYNTGPFTSVLAAKKNSNDGSLSIFGYSSTQYQGTGVLPYYNPPVRQWGFDVGLLSQSPDLFAQKSTQQSSTPPDEFFREVGRDDLWVKTLLCAAQGSSTSYTYAVDASERPNSCLSLGSYND